jgi:hypothetical protein
MKCYHATQGKLEQCTPEEESSFEMADNLFRATAKELWDTLDAKCSVSDARRRLNLMEQLFNYKMVEDRYVVEQVH